MDQGEQFLDHCHENNISEVKKCLSRGVDVNTVSGDGDWSGLIIAAWNDYSDLVDLLLAQPDIKINNTTRHFPRLQWTALMFACEAGNPDIVSRLVEVPGLDRTSTTKMRMVKLQLTVLVPMLTLEDFL